MPYNLKSRALASRRAARPWVIQHGVPFWATNPTVSLFAINPVSTLRSKKPKKNLFKRTVSCYLFRVIIWD